MKDILRDAPAGQIINYLSNGRLLPYADQRPGYDIPERYRQHMPNMSMTTIAENTLQFQPEKTPSQQDVSDTGVNSVAIYPPPALPLSTFQPSLGAIQRHEPKSSETEATIFIPDNKSVDEIEDNVSINLPPPLAVAGDPHLVGWDGPDDPDNPRWVLF
jgi:MFS transporter, DHA1 family, multidrug resistance protein